MNDMTKKDQNMVEEMEATVNEFVNRMDDDCADDKSVDGQPDQDANVTGEEADVCDNSTVDPADQWKDKYLRMAAEFDNYRKRTLREKAELIASGGEDVIKSLLAIEDDLDRAIQAVELATDVESLKEGILLIAKKMDDMLQGRGVTEIPALGMPFDVDLHEAVAKIPVGDKKQKGKIVDVAQKGYKLKDKVIRYAKVVVGE